MKESPLVSVLLCVHNVECFIRETIESIIRQTYFNFEFVIIDDYSSDGTSEIIKSFDDKRIIYYKNEVNLGLTKSLNLGLTKCRGKYIARIDGDDIALPRRLEEQVFFMEKNLHVGISSCWYKEIRPLIISKYRVIKLPLRHHDIKATLLFNNCLLHPGVIIRKSVLDNNKLKYNEHFRQSQDFDLWVRAVDNVELANLSKCLMKYRIHDNQVCNAMTGSQTNFFKETCRFQLNRLQIYPDANDLNIHWQISTGKISALTILELHNHERWLLKILSNNQFSNYYEQVSFKKVIYKKWLFVCENSKLGIKGILFYFQSPLFDSKTFFYSLNGLKLIIKNIIKK